MNFRNLKSALKSRLAKIINEKIGWKTSRKIVVIESDDWGSIRMPNRNTYERTLSAGIPVDKCHYCKYDTIASDSDFSALYDVLRRYKDKNNNNPMITANTVVANPDFIKIKNDSYRNYYFERFTETIKHYPDANFDMWKQGYAEGLFVPQLHGREHLNVERWLLALRNNSKELQFAFKNNFFGVSTSISIENNKSFMAALDYDTLKGKAFGENAIANSCEIFREVFGYSSKSFIAPNYVWYDEIEKVLHEHGTIYIQGTPIQKVPSNNSRFRYLGERNHYNQIYLQRNARFEPAASLNFDAVGNALQEIDRAFRVGLPAVVCTHRVNFIGGIFEENRARNLKLLDELLKEIVSRWPDVEFMTSSMLGELIAEE